MKTIKYTIASLALSIFLIGSSYAQGRFELSYNTALPLGKTTEFVNSYSFRGIGLGGRWETSITNLELGFNTSWNVFFEEEKGTFSSTETRTTSGTQYRYINSVPLYATAYKYYPQTSFTFYTGLGIGTIFNEQRKDFGLWVVTSDGWQFAVAPEIGVLVPAGLTTDLLISIKYNYGAKTSTLPAFSSLGINLGFLF